MGLAEQMHLTAVFVVWLEAYPLDSSDDDICQNVVFEVGPFPLTLVIGEEPTLRATPSPVIR